VAPEAIQKWTGTKRKKFDVPLYFSVVPLQVGGHNKKYGAYG